MAPDVKVFVTRVNRCAFVARPSTLAPHEKVKIVRKMALPSVERVISSFFREGLEIELITWTKRHPQQGRTTRDRCRPRTPSVGRVSEPITGHPNRRPALPIPSTSRPTYSEWTNHIPSIASVKNQVYRAELMMRA